MIKIKLNGERQPMIEDEHGNDLLKALMDQKVYISELVIRCAPNGITVRANMDFRDAEIEVPEEMVSWRKLEVPD